MGNLCTRPPSTLEEDLGVAKNRRTKKKPSPSSSAAAAAPLHLRSFTRTASSSTSSSSPTHRAIRLLGRGAFADTWLFQHLASRRLVAIKLFARPLRRDQVPSILREVGVQAELGPSCARLVEVFECVLTPSHVGVVMEYGAGGSLTSYVGEKWSTALPGGLVVREELARYLFRQVRHTFFPPVFFLFLQLFLSRPRECLERKSVPSTFPLLLPLEREKTQHEKRTRQMPFFASLFLFRARKLTNKKKNSKKNRFSVYRHRRVAPRPWRRPSRPQARQHAARRR